MLVIWIFSYFKSLNKPNQTMLRQQQLLRHFRHPGSVIFSISYELIIRSFYYYSSSEYDGNGRKVTIVILHTWTGVLVLQFQYLGLIVAHTYLSIIVKLFTRFSLKYFASIPIHECSYGTEKMMVFTYLTLCYYITFGTFSNITLTNDK